jgi:hypothetical protein
VAPKPFPQLIDRVEVRLLRLAQHLADQIVRDARRLE